MEDRKGAPGRWEVAQVAETQDGDPLLAACLIEKAAAELKVLGMRPQWRTGRAAPTFLRAV